MTDRAKIEPPADMRAAALTLMQMYIALTDAGFSDVQALTILGRSISRGGRSD